VSASLPAALPDAVLLPAPVPVTVETQTPDLVVVAGAHGGDLLAAMSVEGVQQLTGGARFAAELWGPTGPERVSVFAVDPVAFRPFTPDVTAQAPGVWERLRDGDAVVRHDTAHRLELALGSSARLRRTRADELDVRVGAFASNGVPPLADVVVPWDVGRRLGAGAPNLLVVAVADGASVERTGDAIIEAIGGGPWAPLEPPEESQAEIGTVGFEGFTYTDNGDGTIVIDQAWVDRWITTVDLPLLGRTSCNRVMIPQLVGALDEIVATGLGDHIDPDQFAGSYYPRHIMWDPNRGISMHAWGLAIDINVADNPVGAVPVMDP